MRIVWAFLRLIRLDSSVLGFLTLFVPLLVRTRDVQESTQRAAPLLFIWICAFVANDLDDQERDGINHPGRPLPRGDLTPTTAAVAYFGSLLCSLLTIKQWVREEQAFWYYGVLAIFISYHYVVEHLPILKSVYVAGAIAAPIVVLTRFYPAEAQLVVVAGAAFCFSLGRELCMDVLDRPGDKESGLTRVSATAVAAGAFSIQTVGLLLLFLVVSRRLDLVVLTALSIGTAVAAFCWFQLRRQRAATKMMKGQLVLGLVLLR